MTKYDELLLEAKIRAEAYRSTARVFIPKMYNALREEDPNITSQDARDKIEKDCLGIIWEKRTILNALPDEAKNPEKQKAGRLRQKKQDSAAFSAAPQSSPQKKKQEIIIDTQGKPAENVGPPLSSQLTTASLMPTNGEPCLSNNNCDLLPFEFSLQSGLVLYSMILGYPVNSPIQGDTDKVSKGKGKDNRIWFNGMLHKNTGKVISASIGRITSQQNTIT